MRMMFAERNTGECISLGASLWAGKKVPADALRLLLTDHRTVQGWFEWYERSKKRAERASIATMICTALKAHEAAEESVLYSAASECIGDELLKRTLDQESQAKKLIAAIEAGKGDARDSMLKLRDAVALHINTEENEVFPRVRASDLDLYALGRDLASARAQSLFDLTARAGLSKPDLQEVALMPISKDEARKLFVVGLRNAHAAATEGKSVLDAQLKRLENYPKLKAKVAENRKQKDLQLARFEKILDGLGESKSNFKDATMSIAGSLASMGHAIADDEIMKNSFATFALANYEVAAFESLLLLGEAAEEYSALRPIQECLSEERGMAAFIAENLRGVGMQFLQRRSEGKQASH